MIPALVLPYSLLPPLLNTTYHKATIDISVLLPICLLVFIIMRFSPATTRLETNHCQPYNLKPNILLAKTPTSLPHSTNNSPLTPAKKESLSTRTDSSNTNGFTKPNPPSTNQ